MAGRSAGAAPVPTGAARKRRERARRSQGRHVEWLLSTVAATRSHHTFKGKLDTPDIAAIPRGQELTAEQQQQQQMTQRDTQQIPPPVTDVGLAVVAAARQAALGLL